MRDVEVIRGNERRKAISNQFYNLGAALAGAAAVKFYTDLTYSADFVVWLSGAIALTWAGYGFLGLLEDEE